eukprot:334313-Chlamydomonas_euryale.AAC.1
MTRHPAACCHANLLELGNGGCYDSSRSGCSGGSGGSGCSGCSDCSGGGGNAASGGSSSGSGSSGIGGIGKGNGSDPRDLAEATAGIAGPVSKNAAAALAAIAATAAAAASPAASAPASVAMLLVRVSCQQRLARKCREPASLGHVCCGLGVGHACACLPAALLLGQCRAGGNCGRKRAQCVRARWRRHCML